ncbi:MAG: 2Fe-2S iron-sulfur cluster-binding protein [Pirellulaceae bacterium]|nr:2Fe-2S iron-sulfur cluster-binding protein [Pirellulaceae bacterium]
MTFFLSMLISSFVVLACAPALVSFVPRYCRIRRMPDRDSSEGVGPLQDSIESVVLRTRMAVRETHPTQRRLVEVSKIVPESTETCSIYLSSVDGSELPDFRPGQHIILERPATSGGKSANRCYTLSCGSHDKPWRITVRRQASLDDPTSVSAWIHRDLHIGDRIRIRGPRGSFTLDKADATKPVVFIAAGVGITPMASMLRDELRFDRSRPKWLFYQVRKWDSAPLCTELAQLVETSKTCVAWFTASQSPAPTDCPSKRVRLLHGKFDPNTMLAAIGTTDITAFLCGPDRWMTEMRARFVSQGVPDIQIHLEAFGESKDSAIDLIPASRDADNRVTKTFEVDFEASGKRTLFNGQHPNLISHAKAHAVTIAASCRKGNCGTCAVKLLRGTVEYTCEPEADFVDGEILPCICFPTSNIGVQA